MKAVYKKIREMMIYKGVRGRAAHIFGVIMLVFLGLVFAMPLYWMISTALKYETYCFTTPPQWFPNPIKWSNFTEIFGRMDMARYIKNTLITSILPVIGTLISCPMVAYSITKIPWKGGKYLFPIILMTMMIPSMVTQIPMYATWSKLGMLNTFIPLVLPSFFGSTYYIYLFRQFMKSLPTSVIEAARIDGAGDFRYLLPAGMIM